MEQVGPIVNKYASSVYIMQGIFVGNWGEMNNTTHMGNGEMETLIQKLDDVIDPSIFLSTYSVQCYHIHCLDKTHAFAKDLLQRYQSHYIHYQ